MALVWFLRVMYLENTDARKNMAHVLSLGNTDTRKSMALVWFLEITDTDNDMALVLDALTCEVYRHESVRKNIRWVALRA